MQAPATLSHMQARSGCCERLCIPFAPGRFMRLVTGLLPDAFTLVSNTCLVQS